MALPERSLFCPALYNRNCFVALRKNQTGKDDEEPEFSTPAWFAMLYTTGMGIGTTGMGIGAAVSDNIASALFVTLDNYPISTIMSFVAIILIAAFLITSTDSGTFLVAMLTSGGNQNPARKLKAAWGHPARRGSCCAAGIRWVRGIANGFDCLGISIYAGDAGYVLLIAERLFTRPNLLTVKQR